MCTYVKYTYRDIPRRGKPRGGFNENVFCNATQVFMQSLTGNKLFMKLLAAGGTNGQESCAAEKFSKISWMLSSPSIILSTQLEDSLVPENTVGPLELAAESRHCSFFVSIIKFELNFFETHPPSHVSIV